ncbi:MAG: transcription antitermination factor NusB [Candidatus Kapaibacterium sp.]
MKRKLVVEENPFPLSSTRSVDGNRHIAREKVLQILVAYDANDENRGKIFSHVFHREFTFDENPGDKPDTLLRPEEVFELDSDTPIVWRERDVEFATLLLHKTLDRAEELDEIIERLAKNWELERIALIDKQLLRMALTEIVTFADIPTKVTINEAIELAKSYSTEKSNVFINGILDAACEELTAAGKIVKAGRGLDDGSKTQENDTNQEAQAAA